MRLALEAEKRRRAKARKEEFEQTLENWKADFVSFAKKLDIKNKVGRRMKLKPIRLLTDFESNRKGRDVVVKARQVFFTTWELARDIWYAICNPGSKVVIICPSDKNNTFENEISERISIMLGLDDEAMANPDKKFGLCGEFPDLNFTRVTKREFRYNSNGSVIEIRGAGATIKTAEKGGRGKTIARLHVTELAYFEYAEETLNAVLPAIIDGYGTEIVFECTPMGAAGTFYTRYLNAKKGDDGYRAHLLEWFRHDEYHTKLEEGEVVTPRTEREKELVQVHGVTQEQLKWYRAKVSERGQAKTNQEYPSDDKTCWLFDGRLFFDAEALSRLRLTCKDPIEKYLGGALKKWKLPDPKKTYKVGVDPSNGVGGDPASATVLDADTGEEVAVLHGQFATDDFATQLAKLAWNYNVAEITFERSASWDRLYKTLTEWERPDGSKGYPNIYVDRDAQPGINMNKATRPALLDALEEAIRKSDDKDYLGYKTSNQDFVEEALVFIVKDEKPQAAPGAHDDRIFSAALAYFRIGSTTGLKYTDFAEAPSIDYERTPVSFEDAPVLQEAHGFGIVDDWGGSGLDGF